MYCWIQVINHTLYFLFFLFFFCTVRIFNECNNLVFHWSMSERKTSQVSIPPLRILLDFITVVVWIFSIHTLIYNSASLIFQFLQIITFMIHSFFISMATFKYLRTILPSFIFSISPLGQPNSLNEMLFSYCHLTHWSRVLAGIKWSVLYLKKKMSYTCRIRYNCFIILYLSRSSFL